MQSTTFEATCGSYFAFLHVPGQVRRIQTRQDFTELYMRLPAAVTAFALFVAVASAQQPAAGSHAIVWRDPGDIHSENLFYGIGGEKHAPALPLQYVKEDKHGTSPKFEVTDANGEKWKAKLGPESQAEVVASRLLWAMGFAANEDYYVAETKVPGISGKQKRGRAWIGPNDTVRGIRLQRTPKHEKKVRDWSWENNPVKGTREFNGLRVMMALLSNWDLKDENNAIYEAKDDSTENLYGVTDVGATFGASSRRATNAASKNNLNAYAHHKFIKRVTADEVDFNFPTHPSFALYLMFEFPFIAQEDRHLWVGKHIPRKDVEWMGSLLGQLSHEQIVDAFRAAGYAPDKLEGFTAALESRIAEIKKL